MFAAISAIERRVRAFRSGATDVTGIGLSGTSALNTPPLTLSRISYIVTMKSGCELSIEGTDVANFGFVG